MRLAVLSDIHGNLVALEAALADLDAQGGADRLWFLGDLAAFGPRPVECIRRIKALADAAGEDKQKVRLIRGNTDRYLVTGERPRGKPAADADAFSRQALNWNVRDQQLNWGVAQLAYEDYEFLSKLGGECELHAEGYGYVIGYHGTPGDDEGTLTPETPDDEACDALLDREGRLGIGAHIHVQMDRTLSGCAWRAVNVGAVGLSLEKPGMAQYGLFTFENGAVTVDLRNVPYDTEAVIADLSAVGYPAPEVTMLRLRTAS